MHFFKDLSLSAFTAGFVAVLVGFTSSVAIVFQAALALGATPAMVASWMWALGIGMGLCSLIPSLWLKKPVMVAWSTPGAAVLATAATAGGFGMAEGVGAFILCAALITVAGATGWFERIMNRIPLALASALLAGVLARFGLSGFAAAQSALPLVVLMLRSSQDTGRHRVRWEVTRELLDQAGIEHHTIELPGSSALSEVLQMTYFTDHVSFYVALLNGADPSPNLSIDFLKDRLAKA